MNVKILMNNVAANVTAQPRSSVGINKFQFVNPLVFR